MLLGTANVWYSLCCLFKPFPSFVHLIPAQYAYWNVVKGGSGTTTKLMDDCILRIPKAHLNPETVAITCLIAILIVLFHCLSQTFSSKANLNNYPSLAHYHNAASHRSTYANSLLKVRKIFVKELKAITTNLDEEQSPEQCHNHQQQSNLVKEGKTSEEIEQMCSNCTSIPMKTHPPNYQRCSICEKKNTMVLRRL